MLIQGSKRDLAWTRPSFISQTRNVVCDYAMPCEAKTDGEGHRHRYLRYVARELELGVTSSTEIGALKYSFEDEQAAIRGLEGKLGAGWCSKGVYS